MTDIISKLFEDKVLSVEAAETVRAAVKDGKLLDDALHAAPGVNEEQLLRALADEFGLPFIDLEREADKHVPPKDLLKKLPARILIDHAIMPIAQSDEGITVV